MIINKNKSFISKREKKIFLFKVTKRDKYKETKKNQIINRINDSIKENNSKKERIIKDERKLNKKTTENKTGIYSQNYNNECFQGTPPRKPIMFLHKFISYNKNVFSKKNEVIGICDKNLIPNVFYNHLITNERTYINNNLKYNKFIITQRNKKKLLTVNYYSPTLLNKINITKSLY